MTLRCLESPNLSDGPAFSAASSYLPYLPNWNCPYPGLPASVCLPVLRQQSETEGGPCFLTSVHHVFSNHVVKDRSSAFWKDRNTSFVPARVLYTVSSVPMSRLSQSRHLHPAEVTGGWRNAAVWLCHVCPFTYLALGLPLTL